MGILSLASTSQSVPDLCHRRVAFCDSLIQKAGRGVRVPTFARRRWACCGTLGRLAVSGVRVPSFVRYGHRHDASQDCGVLHTRFVTSTSLVSLVFAKSGLL